MTMNSNDSNVSELQNIAEQIKKDYKSSKSKYDGVHFSVLLMIKSSQVRLNSFLVTKVDTKHRRILRDNCYFKLMTLLCQQIATLLEITDCLLPVHFVTTTMSI
jgi:hypothetical protein